ncbi:unnamed protein product (macronuclear) [Paramecium tetraurelia]|uniref:PX domain-containing protein n=1 Tax=Paramecium tetraurelia TaxID=5888 RepID=A0CJU8_PARTE|nr:uncharacterized protein GSPATT00000777001 [Paramecium tetraurelia]CAK71065.1 unnamed protein product [Paramecium tetraurelia]|eukprot:XP_001438462.1 hypothetical protein (macronuclear) [Paramecium tetraurelia strain d4-2]
MQQNQEGDKPLKEQYLQDQVEKGLDADLCAQFLVSLKPEGGDDIDNWSLDELKSAIEQFKESQKQAEEQQPNNSEDQGNLQQAQPQEQPQQNQQIIQQSNTPVLVNCYQILPNELSGDNVAVKILTYKKESAGFFSSSYIVFQIETQPQGWIVFRRYSDFEWLRDSLQKFYPAFVVPPIHKKRSRSFEDSYLNKRVIFLQRFLNSIFKSYELKSNVIVKNFLSLTQNNEFKKFQEVQIYLSARVLLNLLHLKQYKECSQRMAKSIALLPLKYINMPIKLRITSMKQMESIKKLEFQAKVQKKFNYKIH